MENRQHMRITRMLFLCIILMLSSCQLEKTTLNKVEDASYEILEEGDFPEKVKEILAEKKENDFKIVYKDNEYLYILRGYGKKETGGYSISIKELYFSKNALVFKSELVGPKKGETVIEKNSYPYIVVKTKETDKNVVFE